MVHRAECRGRARPVAGGLHPALPGGGALRRALEILDLVVPHPRQPVPRPPAQGPLVEALDAWCGRSRVERVAPRPPAGVAPGPRGHDRAGADVEAGLGGRGPARATAARGSNFTGAGGAADAGDRGGAEVLRGDGAGAPPPRARNTQEDDGGDLTRRHIPSRNSSSSATSSTSSRVRGPHPRTSTGAVTAQSSARSSRRAS